MSVNVYKNGGLVSIAGNGTGNEDFVGTRAEVQAALPTLPDGTTIYITDDVSPDGLPLATTTKPGVVQPDGNTINVDQNGVISAAAEVPIATTTTAGKVKPDGTTISVSNDGTISGASPTPIATTAVAGKVKPDGTTISVNSSGTISANVTVPIATTNIVGGIKASNIKDISVNSAGALSIDPYYYKLDRRKLFSQGLGYTTPFSGAMNISNNTTAVSPVAIPYSGIYFLTVEVYGVERSMNGTIKVNVYDGSNNQIGYGVQNYALCYMNNTLMPQNIYTMVYCIAPLQKNTYPKINVSGIGSDNHIAYFHGSLVYEFTNSTVDTSHWWNSSNIIS